MKEILKTAGIAALAVGGLMAFAVACAWVVSLSGGV